MFFLRLLVIFLSIQISLCSSDFQYKGFRSKAIDRKVKKKPSFAKDISYTILGLSSILSGYFFFNQSVRQQREYEAILQQEISKPSAATEASRTFFQNLGSMIFAIKKGPASTPYRYERSVTERDELLLELNTKILLYRALTGCSLSAGIYFIAKGMHFIK